jgi:D-glycero-alpha-D-manno-heptose-7-phosphate kinase
MGAVVVRAPLRVALGGGGTDLPSYFREHGGLVVSTAIDRYVHMTVSPRFARRFVLKHLEWEEVDHPREVRHPILRAALEHHWNGGAIELASVGDAPPGTGLGSSGAYSVCVLAALAALSGRTLERGELAEAACHLEIELVGRSIGKQDQYAAAFGGVRAYEFRPDGGVDVRELQLAERTRAALRDEFLLFFTGTARSASEILGAGQVEEALHRLKQLAGESCAALEAGDLDALAELMHEHWEAKRRRAPGTVTPDMDALRERALAAGARGVISLGAGGGGFLLVYTPDPERTRAALDAPELAFGLDDEGATTLR